MTEPRSEIGPPADDTTETPPWHAYDGCFGCRRGNAIAEKAMKRTQDDADV